MNPQTKPTRPPSMRADRAKPNTGGWQDRHDSAVWTNEAPELPNTFEHAIVCGVESWAEYATCHLARYESPIGQDHILGPMWRDWGLALRGLLNGETGRLDCGTLDGFILATLEANGVETEGL